MKKTRALYFVLWFVGAVQIFQFYGCGDIIGPIDIFGDGTMADTPTIPPYTPTPVSPSNAASGVDTSVYFGWLEVYSASSYTVEVAMDSQFSRVVKSESTKLTTCTLTGFTKGTVYYWRVKAVNPQGNSEYSEVFHFKTKAISPVLLTPANGETGQATNLTLSWSSISGATSYSIEISFLDTFTTYAYKASSVSATSIQPMGLLPNTTYYWRVRALTDTSYSAYSAVFHFTTAP